MRISSFGALCMGLLALGLSACGTTHGPRTDLGPGPNVGAGQKPVGSDYYVVHFDGLSARGGMPAIEPARWTADEYADVQELDYKCRVQMAPYIPSMARELGVSTLRTGIPTGIGAALGAVAAYTHMPFGDYAKQVGIITGGSAAGSGFGAGWDRAQLARRYVQYACMQFSMSYANKFGRLVGVSVLPAAGASAPRPTRVPAPAASETGTMPRQAPRPPPGRVDVPDSLIPPPPP